MIVQTIKYKGVKFDEFDAWNDDEQMARNGDDIKSFIGVDSVRISICPWCVKRHGFYAEVEREPESIDEEIEFYKDEDPTEIDEGYVCSVRGCYNHLADDAYIYWGNVEV